MSAWIVLALWMSGDLKPEARTPAALHLRIDQDGRLSKGELQVAVEEIRRIWDAAGVQVSSARFGDAVPEGRTVVSMRIVTMPIPAEGRRVLGFVTADVQQQAMPTIFIR